MKVSKTESETSVADQSTKPAPKKKKQKKVQEPEVPEQDFKPFDYSQSNFKIFDGKTLPFFICMFPIGSLSSLFVFDPHRQIKREFTVWSKQTSTWTQAEGMNLFSVTQLSAGMDLAVLHLISLPTLILREKDRRKTLWAAGACLTSPSNLTGNTHTARLKKSIIDKMCMMGLFLFPEGFATTGPRDRSLLMADLPLFLFSFLKASFVTLICFANWIICHCFSTALSLYTYSFVVFDPLLKWDFKTFFH